LTEFTYSGIVVVTCDAGHGKIRSLYIRVGVGHVRRFRQSILIFDIRSWRCIEPRSVPELVSHFIGKYSIGELSRYTTYLTASGLSVLNAITAGGEELLSSHMWNSQKWNSIPPGRRRSAEKHSIFNKRCRITDRKTHAGGEDWTSASFIPLVVDRLVQTFADIMPSPAGSRRITDTPA